MDFKMTQEERLVLRLRYNDRRKIVLNKFGVRHLIRSLGWSPIKVARVFPRISKGGNRELAKWAVLFFLRDLGIALPSIIVILYTLFK